MLFLYNIRWNGIIADTTLYTICIEEEKHHEV